MSALSPRILLPISLLFASGVSMAAGLPLAEWVRCATSLLLPEPNLVAPPAPVPALTDLGAVARWHDADPKRLSELWKTDSKTAHAVSAMLYEDLANIAPFSDFPNELITVLENVGAIQLENLCRVQCPWCGFDHNKKGKYRQFSPSVLRQLFAKMAWAPGRRANAGPTMLYYESEPFGYSYEIAPGIIYKYPEVHRLFRAFLGYDVAVSTVIHKGSEEEVFRFARERITAPAFRISLSHLNRDRLTSKPEDGVSILERLVSLEAAYKLALPVGFESAPTWEVLTVLKEFDWNQSWALLQELGIGKPAHEVRKRALYDLVAQIQKRAGHAAAPLAKKMDQMNLMFSDISPRRIGRAFDETHAQDQGIGCFNGILITPDAIFNVVQTNPASPEFPSAQAVVRLTQATMVRSEAFPPVARLSDLLKLGVVQQQQLTVGENLGENETREFQLWGRDYRKRRYTVVRYQGKVYAMSSASKIEDVLTFAATENAPRASLPVIP